MNIRLKNNKFFAIWLEAIATSSKKLVGWRPSLSLFFSAFILCRFKKLHPPQQTWSSIAEALTRYQQAPQCCH